MLLQARATAVYDLDEPDATALRPELHRVVATRNDRLTTVRPTRYPE